MERMVKRLQETKILKYDLGCSMLDLKEFIYGKETVAKAV